MNRHHFPRISRTCPRSTTCRSLLDEINATHTVDPDADLRLVYDLPA